MTDFALKYQDGVIDFILVNGDLGMDDGLESAVLLSLLCDARVSVEELPHSEDDPGGFWGDFASEVEGDSTGSKLRLLRREKLTNETATRAKKYCEEALQWLIDDKIASDVAVTTEIINSNLLLIAIEIKRPSGRIYYKFDYIWQSQGLKV
ncbi:MAG: hypothetical protein COB04_16035 [Gammaproteobacteria bacterium]|nr:MAG: hypothetical protein COB04_16035 [Gammaproteobacteria bacterium]